MKGLHGGAPPSPVKRQSSYKTAQDHKIYFLSALATIRVPVTLLSGVPIFTVAANGITSPAVLTLSRDRFTAYIRREGSAKSANSSVFSFGSRKTDAGASDRAIDIGEMDRIQRGQSTQQFEFAKKHAKALDVEVVLKKADLIRDYSSGSTTPSNTLALIQQLDPSLSFSIIFRGAHTVDLMAQTKAERDEICDTLDAILVAYQRGKIRVSTDVLLLRYVFLDVDKDKTGYVTATQMGKVLQAINFNMKQKDVVSAYEQFGKVIGLDRAHRRKGLTFEQAATFLHKVRIRNAHWECCFCSWEMRNVTLTHSFSIFFFLHRSNATVGW